MKKVIRAVIAAAAIVLAYIGCSRILTLKSEDGIDQMQSFYLQKEQTVDVLLLGSSHIYCDVNTGILWDEFGISAFDLGGAEQPYWNSYYFLKEALRTQKPKVIVLDVTIPGIRSVEYQPEVWSVTNLYGMKWNQNRIEATKISTPENKYKSILSPMNIMHTRYDELTKNDFIDENRSIDYKGFDLREAVVPFETPDMTFVADETPMTEKEELYYRKIIELTKKENIPLLLVSVPFPVYDEAQKVYNYEFRIAREENIPYIDFNKGTYYEEIGLDFEKDMADEFHLNTVGNEKFSKYLGDLLVREYALTDHRKDSAYSSWEKDARIQRQETARVRLEQAQEEGKYLLELLNDQYLTFIAVGDAAENAAFMQNNKNVLGRLGIDANIDYSNHVMISNGEKLLYLSGTDEQRAFLDQDSIKLLLVREKKGDSSPKTKLFVNEQSYSMNTSGIKIVVYDKTLKRVVGEREFEP